MYKKLSIIALISVSACTTVGGEFCKNNGYEKDSHGYKQCTSHYQANREFYEFCTQNKGITIQGQPLNQCLQTARGLKNNWLQDRGFCQQEANRKFTAILSRPKEEKQPTLLEDGTIEIGSISLGIPYSSADKRQLTKPFVDQCLQVHGWYDAQNWQRDKRNATLGEITTGLSHLNAQSVSVSTPVHASVDLFTAAAEGNVHALENALNASSAQITNHQGYTALHVAARRGQFHSVQILLETFGANPDALSHKGESAIALASYGQHHAIAHYITEFKIKQERQRIEEELRSQIQTNTSSSNAKPTGDFEEQLRKALLEKWK